MLLLVLYQYAKTNVPMCRFPRSEETHKTRSTRTAQLRRQREVEVYSDWST